MNDFSDMLTSPNTPALLLRGGRIVDPANNRDGPFDILIEDGLIKAIDSNLPVAPGIPVLDASGLIVTPGLIDIHVHLREPGYEHKETILSGAEAAAAGGFTAVACMANTSPVVDTPEVVTSICERAASAPVHVYPIAAVTRSLLGQELTPVEDLRSTGAIAFSDDGMFVADPVLMREALSRAKTLEAPVITHPEIRELTRGGVMNEGPVAATLGVRGMPKIAEEIAIYRDIALAAETGAHLHIAHVSTEEGVALIRRAKACGIHVTAEVTPHHLTLTDEAVAVHGADAKMSPPLRAASDIESLIAGLCDGTIDVVATDHAPHAPFEKAKGLVEAPFGIIGLETAVGLILTHLVHPGLLSLPRMVEVMSVVPTKILGIPGGRIDIGVPADLTLIDPDLTWTVAGADLRSKSRNTPYIGATLKGRVSGTIVNGRVVYEQFVSIQGGTL
jgi:dihydroorotase